MPSGRTVAEAVLLLIDGGVAQWLEPMEHNQENDIWFLSKVKDGTLTVNKNGTIFNNKTKRYIGAPSSNGYLKISLTKEKVNGKWIIAHMQVHRLVWLVYNGLIPQGIEVNHCDANKLNPALDNLELLTPSSNSRHAMKAGLLHLFKKGNTYHLLRNRKGRLPYKQNNGA